MKSYGGGGVLNRAGALTRAGALNRGNTVPLVPLVRVELHSLGLGVSVSPLVALVSVELHSLGLGS